MYYNEPFCSRQSILSVVLDWLIWATYPFLWILNRHRAFQTVKPWRILVNPVLWLLLILPVLFFIDIIPAWYESMLGQVIFYGEGILCVVGALSFALFFYFESQKLRLPSLHVVFNVLLAFMTLSFSNIISNILFNLLLPAIMGVRKISVGNTETDYRKCFAWMSWINTICASVLFLIIFFAFIMGVDS